MVLPLSWGRSGRADHQAAVVATEAEGVGQDRPRLPRTGRARHDVEMDLGVRLLVADGRRDAGPGDGQDGGHRLDGPAGAETVPGGALDRRDRRGLAPEDLADGVRLGLVVEGGG